MKNQTKGAISLATVGILYSLYSVYSKIMGGAFSPFFQSFSRGLIVFTILLAILIVKGGFKLPKKSDMKWFLLTGFSAGFIDTFFFIGINHLTIGTTLFIFYATSTLANFVWGSLMFGEKINRKKLFAASLAVAGLVLLYKESLSLSSARALYLIAAFAAGFLFSIYGSFSKKVSGSYDSIQIALSNNLFAVLITFCCFILLRETANTNFASQPWLANLLFAATQTVIMPLIVYGFRHIEAQKGSLLLLLELVFGVIWGMVIFHEFPGAYAIAGNIMIMAALIIPFIDFPLVSLVKNKA